MVRVPTDLAAAERLRWLDELSGALQDAQELLWRLGAGKPGSADALDLSARIETAAAEVRSLSFARPRPESRESAPEWTNQQVWDSSKRDRAKLPPADPLRQKTARGTVPGEVPSILPSRRMPD